MLDGTKNRGAGTVGIAATILVLVVIAAGYFKWFGGVGPETPSEVNGQVKSFLALSASDRAAADAKLKEIIEMIPWEEKVATAKAELYVYLEKYPGDARAHFHLARARMAEHDGKTAYEAVRDAIRRAEARSAKSNKNFQATVHELAGKLSRDLDQIDQARKHFEIATELNPQNASHWIMLAQIYLDRRKYDQAKSFLNKALEVNAKAVAAHGRLAEIALAERQYTRSIEHIDSALKHLDADKERERYVKYIMYKQDALRRIGKPREALELLFLLEEGAAAKKRDLASQFALAYEKLGEFHAAGIRWRLLAEDEDQPASIQAEAIANAARWYALASRKSETEANRARSRRAADYLLLIAERRNVTGPLITEAKQLLKDN